MEYLEKMKTIQNQILEFLDDQESTENFDDFSSFLDFQQNQIDIQELKSILRIIYKIAKNHHRGPFFFEKIKKIIIHFKKEIKQAFSNIEIFNLFKKCQRILLLLIDEDILAFDQDILQLIEKYNYKDYFIPEINKLNPNEDSIKLPEYYDEKRHKGENDYFLCEIIRNDEIENFIIYYNKNEFSLSMQIKTMAYETNSFLKNKNPTLIEYSAFFGSIQILQFLFQNNVRVTSSLWMYAIHGQNPEIIHFLEYNHISPDDLTYVECLKESIKCHNNDFANYFKNNFIKNDDLKVSSNYLRNEAFFGFRFYNFQFIPTEIDEKFYFYYAVEYDYYHLVKFYLNIDGLNINEMIIL